MRRLASGVLGCALTLAGISASRFLRHSGGLTHAALHVLNDALANSTPEINGHCVTDHSAEQLELNRLPIRHE
jgi:hypothetical protein